MLFEFQIYECGFMLGRLNLVKMKKMVKSQNVDLRIHEENTREEKLQR